MHLSRLAEELVIWSSAQFRFVALSGPVLDRVERSCRRRRTPTPPS
jgi:hypothetical protein